LVGERKNNELDKVMTSKILAEASLLTKQVQVSEQLISLIQQLVASSRPDDSSCPADLKSALWFGAGPRGGLSLIAASRAHAFLNGRDHIRWSDIRRLAKPVLRHRMRLSTEALHDNMTEDMVITQLLKKVEERHKIV
jgi:MoxR-like ATPase